MEGIPKTRIEELRDLLKGESLAKSFIESLIAECKELPAQKWQTIDEFKANPVDGFAFVKSINLDVPIMTYTKNVVFYDTGSFMDSEFISHVMPIKTPEAPK